MSKKSTRTKRPKPYGVPDIDRVAEDLAAAYLPDHLAKFKRERRPDYELIQRECWDAPLEQIRATVDFLGGGPSPALAQVIHVAACQGYARLPCDLRRVIGQEDWLTLLRHFRLRDFIAEMFGDHDPKFDPKPGWPPSVYTAMKQMIYRFAEGTMDSVLTPHARRIAERRRRYLLDRHGTRRALWALMPAPEDLQYDLLVAADRLEKNRGMKPDGEESESPRDALVARPRWPKPNTEDGSHCDDRPRHQVTGLREVPVESTDGTAVKEFRRGPTFVRETPASAVSSSKHASPKEASLDLDGLLPAMGQGQPPSIFAALEELEAKDLVEQLEAHFLGAGDRAALAELRHHLTEAPRREIRSQFPGVTEDAMRSAFPRIEKLARALRPPPAA